MNLLNNYSFFLLINLWKCNIAFFYQFCQSALWLGRNHCDDSYDLITLGLSVNCLSWERITFSISSNYPPLFYKTKTIKNQQKLHKEDSVHHPFLGTSFLGIDNILFMSDPQCGAVSSDHSKRMNKFKNKMSF